jgi:hypothetical protein
MAKPMKTGSLPLASAPNQLAVGGVALQQVWGRPVMPAAFTARAVRLTEAPPPPPAPAPMKAWNWPKI